MRSHAVLVATLALLACGSGGGDPAVSSAFADCAANCAADALTAPEVEDVVARAVLSATAAGASATVAVTDRLGNVLAVYRMPGAATSFRIDGGTGAQGGLESVAVLPDTLAAISKAITAAYLSSAGNAFSTRTASQIIQENFNPREANQPSGPLFGVQFSQLSCSDVMLRSANAPLGPQRAPLGLAADAGGLPLYKDGRLVGGVGVIADGVYGLDLDISNVDNDLDETIAMAASAALAAPPAILASRITADGRSLRFADAPAVAPGAAPPALSSLPGSLVAVSGYFSPPAHAGVAFGTAASGIRKDTGPLGAQGGYVLVDGANANRYPASTSAGGLLTANEVQALLSAALDIANRSRAQIRLPNGSPAQVSISVVGVQGDIAGLVRTPDAPVFGIDVAVQKARSAVFFSSPASAAALAALPDANYLTPPTAVPIAPYVSNLRSFLGRSSALTDGMAFSARAIGNLARPTFPDGIAGTPNGPLSVPFGRWSPFNDGLQLDLAYNAIVAGATGSALVGCTGLPNLQNGLQIFPGGFPLYRIGAGGTAQLVGGVGISGDGVDQDDMVAFLSIVNAARTLGTGLAHAPAGQRADTLTLPGGQLRYVQCPQSPFNNSSEQNVCAGL